MNKKIALLLFFICTLGLLSYFSITSNMANLSDETIAFLGFGLLTIAFFLKRFMKG